MLIEFMLEAVSIILCLFCNKQKLFVLNHLIQEKGLLKIKY